LCFLSEFASADNNNSMFFHFSTEPKKPVEYSLLIQ
jgi:hypothetical protein